jgi:hypothetical protein
MATSAQSLGALSSSQSVDLGRRAATASGLIIVTIATAVTTHATRTRPRRRPVEGSFIMSLLLRESARIRRRGDLAKKSRTYTGTALGGGDFV